MADSRLGVYSRNNMFVDDGTVTVNGIRLGDLGWYLTAAPEVDAIAFDTSYTTVTGAHGSRDMSLTDGSGLAYAGRRTVTLHLRTVGTWQEAVKSKVALGSIVGRDARITWRALPGDFIGRLESSSPSEVWQGGVFAYYEIDLTMSAMPLLCGKKTAVSGTKLTVNGNCRVFPTFTATLKAEKKLKISRADGVFIEVDAEKSFSAGITAVIETSPTKSRGVYINGVLTCPTLTSDFFDLPVGDSTITVVGASSITTSYEPLWLIP